MNFSWNLAKILLASLLIILAIFGAYTQLKPSSYSGADLSFAIGHGTVTMTNPSSEPVAIQVLSTGTRSFKLTSTNPSFSGTSTRIGNGSTSTQFLDLLLPVGQTEFSVANGTNISFAATTPVLLEASVQGLSEIETRAVIGFAGIVILGALFYISRLTGHRWLAVLRGQGNAPAAVPVVAVVETAQGTAARSYGDNRK